MDSSGVGQKDEFATHSATSPNPPKAFGAARAEGENSIRKKCLDFDVPHHTMYNPFAGG